MKLFLYTCVLFFCACSLSMASHLVGGEMGLRHVQGNTYQLSLTLYFDNLHGVPGTDEPSVTVSVFSKAGNALLQRVTLTKTSNTAIKYIHPACSSSGISTSVFVYQNPINLSPAVYNSPSGYYISWERCCRNEVINNILQPGATGMVFYMEFPAVTANNAAFINNSPIMNPVAGDILCLGELFTYSYAATDADGDQLVYSLETPLKGHSTPTNPLPVDQPGPYAPVIWGVGFSATNAIPGAPALTINPQTGMLTVAPFASGLFVFTVVCSEYRNGVKIGEVRRDFQWKVIECRTNQAPTVRLQLPDGSTYQQGDTLFIRNAEDLCYNLFFKDSIQSQLTFEIVPVNFTAPVLSIIPSSGTITASNVPIEAKLCWPDCSESRPQGYTFDVVVRDQVCPQPMSSRLRVTVLVVPDPNVKPNVSTSLGSQIVQYLQIGQSVTFDVTGTDPDNDIVTLSAEGEGFSVSGIGMQFEGGSAAGTITSTFFWQPDCSALLSNQPLRVVFRARDNSCYSSHQDTTSVLFYVQDIDNLESEFIPVNIFTPNNDGVNDVFIFPNLPRDNCAGHFESTQVFSRWGKRVFEGTSATAFWDAQGVSDGIYYYLVTFSHKVYKGTVTVVR